MTKAIIAITNVTCSMVIYLLSLIESYLVLNWSLLTGIEQEPCHVINLLNLLNIVIHK